MRIVVNAVLVRARELLMTKHSAQRRTYPGLWSFPGGHVEGGETLAQALVREAREEVGILVIEFQQFAEIADPNALPSDPATYHLYAVTAWQGGEPRIVDDEHSKLRWFTPEAAIVRPDLALAGYRPILRDLGERLPFT